MGNLFEKRISVTFNVARVFAMLSIVSAHLTFTDSCPYIISKLYSTFGSIGVVAFLIISGYYYNSSKYKNPLYLLKDKAIRLGIPWMFWGSLSFVYGRLMTGEGFFFGDYLRYIVGDGSFLYYLTILVLCYLIFYKTNSVILIVSVITSIISLMLTASGLVNGYVSFMRMTNYLNIFNWVGIFALGILLRKIEPEKLYRFFVGIRWYVLGAFAIFVSAVCYFDLRIGYFSHIGIWLEILGALTIFSISTIKIFDNKVFTVCAELSFVVYLTNIVANGVVNDLYNLSWVTQALSGFIVTGGCCFCFWAAKKISNLIKVKKIVYPILGIRERKVN